MNLNDSMAQPAGPHPADLIAGGDDGPPAALNSSQAGGKGRKGGKGKGKGKGKGRNHLNASQQGGPPEGDDLHVSMGASAMGQSMGGSAFATTEVSQEFIDSFKVDTDEKYGMEHTLNGDIHEREEFAALIKKLKINTKEELMRANTTIYLKYEAARQKGENNEETVQATHDFGMLLKAIGNHAPSEEKFREAYQKRKELLPENDVRTQSSYLCLGLQLIESGNVTEATEIFNELLRVREKLNGPNSRETLIILNYLGGVEASIKRYPEAREIW